MNEDNTKWKFAVDTGGTFTDVVGLNETGRLRTLKLLSHSSAYRDASVEGIRRMLALDPGEPLPETAIKGIRFGTTVATNALLEKKGGRVLLLITEGLSDLLQIGYQNRPDIFRLCTVKPLPLYSELVEVDERLDSGGNVVRGLDAAALGDAVRGLDKSAIDAVCVVLMHSWINPVHELLCEEILLSNGFSNVFLSHRTASLIKIVMRGQTTLVDAYLSVVLSNYMKEIRKKTGCIDIRFMQSNGIPCRPEHFTGKNAILSGPAGGVVAVSRALPEAGSQGVIGFDMGGTSTDVSRLDGRPEMSYERVIGGLPLQAEALNIVTVAAGGGSILAFDGQKMTVGPQSAGSRPGAACYGLGGPLTITDANLLTGRLVPAYFPRTFGPDGTAPLDTSATREKFNSLSEQINDASSASLTPQEIAAGFLRIANEKMAMAIKEISVSKGLDARQYALVCFGGAGGQHACHIASLLDISKILIHPLSGVMSAYGIGLAKEARRTARTVLLPCDRDRWFQLGRILAEMEGDLLGEDTDPAEDFTFQRELDLRPAGAETALTIPYGEFKDSISFFLDQYERFYGFRPATEELEIVTVRTEVRSSSEFFPAFTEASLPEGRMTSPASYHEIYYAGGMVSAPVYWRESLSPGFYIEGPALILDSISTVVVDHGFRAEVGRTGFIVITAVSQNIAMSAGPSAKPDPVLLEVFNNIFTGIAAEMGITLRNTAHSVNMKERLDFSCGVFDSEGSLVANAPHIPVHLGSMPETIKAVLEDSRGTMKPGDVYLTNNPYRGGSHLPDLTVVCPVFSSSGEVIFFTAARGHHSDIGGRTPGSMPSSAAHIGEEGILIDSLLIVRDGIFREDRLREVISITGFPARNIPERIADVKAQIAAAHKGVVELSMVISKYGWDTVRQYMAFIQENASYSVKKALFRLLRHGRVFSASFEDHLDDASLIRVAITIDAGPDPPATLRAVIDFTGTGKQHRKDNLNAALSVTKSAVLYVLRCLIDSDIPLNSGCLDPVDIIVPPGTILSPAYPAAVASGNVETSQRVVDVLLGALGAAAASQGTMNNLLFEAEGETPYYETIAGGAGALPGCPGASGIQVHMTNTRITDPEILELRHPGVRLRRFTLRKGSGGRGRYSGGDGVIREIEFLKAAIVSILSERRVFAPYGMAGGSPGEKGLNLWRKATGATVSLGHRCVLSVDAGDSIIIETPGGGGYGKETDLP